MRISDWSSDVCSSDLLRLYADGTFPTANGRAQFLDTGYTPVAENISAPYPLHLTTGRLRDHWHTMSRTGLVPALTRHVEQPFIYLHPQDMQRYKVQNDALLKIKTRRGNIVLPVQGDPGLKPGHAFLPMHWGSGFISGQGINALISNVRDPISHQPELKHSAAGIEVLKYDWHATAWIQGPCAPLRQRLAP